MYGVERGKRWRLLQSLTYKEVYDIVHRNEKLAAPSAGKTRRKDRVAGKDKEKAVPRR